MYLKSLILVLLIIASSSLMAQRQPISLEEAMQKASSNNYSILLMQQRLASLQVDTEIRKADMYPTFSLGASYLRNSEETKIVFSPLPKVMMQTGNRYDTNLSIQEVLFAGNRIRQNYILSRQQYQSQALQLENLRNQIRLQTGSLYYQIQANRMAQNMLLQSKQRGQNQLHLVQQLLIAKQAIPFDTLEVANRILSIDTQLSELQQNEEVLHLRFNVLLNSNQSYTPMSYSQEYVRSAQHDINDLLNQAKSQNSDLKLIQSQFTAQKTATKARKSVLLPQMVGGFSYHYANPGTNALEEKWMDYYSINAGFSWEFWNWRKNYNQVKQMQIEEKRLTLQADQTWQNLEEQIRETYVNLQITERQISLQERLVQQETERYRILRDRFQEGLATNLELNSGERHLTEAQLQLQQKYISQAIYRLQMDNLTGTLNQGSNK